MKNDNESRLIALSERGVDYPAGTRTSVFCGELLYVWPPNSLMVDVFKLPLSLCAEVWHELPVGATPFSADFVPELHLPETCDEPTEIITNRKTYDLLIEMDEKLVGTEDYMGLAYFWNYEFRHTLRDASAVERVKVHAAFLANSLWVAGDTPAHRRILNLVFKDRNTGL